MVVKQLNSYFLVAEHLKRNLEEDEEKCCP